MERENFLNMCLLECDIKNVFLIFYNRKKSWGG